MSGCAQFPKIIENVFITKQINEAGIYELNLFQGGREVRVVVDDFIPCNQFGKAAFSSNHGKEIWVMILEKAYAKLHGSYSRLSFSSLLLTHTIRFKLGISRICISRFNWSFNKVHSS